MPKYMITSPSGESFEITAPDGANEDDVLAYAKTQFSNMETAPSYKPRMDSSYGSRGALGVVGPLRSVAQGVTFGFGDEIESAITGTPVGQIRADMKAFSGGYPAADIAGQVGGGSAAAAVGGGLLSAAKSSSPAVAGLAQKGAQWVGQNVPRWAQIAGTSAGGGAAVGAGTEEEGRRVSGAVAGGILGGAIGVAVPAGGAVLRRAYDAILKPLARAIASTPAKEARRLVEESLASAGLTPDAALRAVQDYGDEGMMLDLAPALRDLAYDARSGIGPGRQIIDEALQSRQIGQQSRIMTAAGQELGAHADDAKAFVDAITKAQKEQAAPLYASAHQQNIRITPEFEKLWSGVPKSAIDRAKELARREWHAGLIDMPESAFTSQIRPDRSLPPPGGLLGEVSGDAPGFDFDALPDVLRIDYVKRAYDDTIAGQIRAGEKQISRADVTLRNKLLDYVDAQVPDFQKARGIWAGGEQLKSAAEFGQDVFKENADDMAEIVARYGESEKQAFRYGVAQAFRDKIEGAKLTGDAAQRLAGSTKNQRIIKAAFGDLDQFNAFMKRIENERVFTESRYEITGNSKTAERLQRRRERSGDIPDPSHAGLMAWLSRQFGPSDPLTNKETNRIVSEMLTRRVSGQAQPAASLLTPGMPVPVNQGIPGGLLRVR